MTTTELVLTDEEVVIKYAGMLAQPHLRLLAKKASMYPASYDRQRVMEEADAILDMALGLAADAQPPRWSVKA